MCFYLYRWSDQKNPRTGRYRSSSRKKGTPASTNAKSIRNRRCRWRFNSTLLVSWLLSFVSSISVNFSIVLMGVKKTVKNLFSTKRSACFQFSALIWTIFSCKNTQTENKVEKLLAPIQHDVYCCRKLALVSCWDHQMTSRIQYILSMIQTKAQKRVGLLMRLPTRLR